MSDLKDTVVTLNRDRTDNERVVITVHKKGFAQNAYRAGTPGCLRGLAITASEKPKYTTTQPSWLEHLTQKSGPVPYTMFINEGWYDG